MTLKKILLCAVIVASLSACRHEEDYTNIDTTNLIQLENAHAGDSSSSACNGGESSPASNTLRHKALEDSAMSIGAQAGLAWSSQMMNKRMLKDRKYLDTIFNFNGMVLSHGIMPPVLVQGDHTLNLADPNTIRVADRTYKIVEQAHFATTPPNWREYLWMTYEKPELPHRSLLPRNAEEQKVWRRGVRAGWEKGIQQGYNIFHQNLARLKRDYLGMALYRRLLQQKMINPPFVARTELGVTGDGTDMRINDQVLRIVEQPELQTNSRGWRAIVVPNNE